MIRRIAPDKWKHFFVGILMGAFLQGLLSWLLPSQLALASLFAFLVVIAVSYGFELFSKITGLGHYDFMDAVASIAGGGLGMGLIWLATL